MRHKTTPAALALIVFGGTVLTCAADSVYCTAAAHYYDNCLANSGLGASPPDKDQCEDAIRPCNADDQEQLADFLTCLEDRLQCVDGKITTSEDLNLVLLQCSPTRELSAECQDAFSDAIVQWVPLTP